MENERRVAAGRRGKLAGHAFERDVAAFLGLGPDAVDGGSRTKVDIWLPGSAASLKNAGGRHTQVALYSPHKFADYFSLTGDQGLFLRLFFGEPSPAGDDAFRALVASMGVDPRDLSLETEVKRRRVLAHNLPRRVRSAGLSWFNEHKDEVFEAVVQSGLGSGDSVDTLGWAFRKSDPSSVKWYDLDEVRSYAMRGQWSVARSSAVLEYRVLGERLMYVQMKGSGGDGYDSAARHGMMFHLYGGALPTAAEIQVG